MCRQGIVPFVLYAKERLCESQSRRDLPSYPLYAHRLNAGFRRKVLNILV
jgi:hypothetical protein